jgi:hypothetical protein
MSAASNEQKQKFFGSTIGGRRVPVKNYSDEPERSVASRLSPSSSP